MEAHFQRGGPSPLASAPQNYPFVSNEKKNHASWMLGPHLFHLTFGLHLYQLLNHRKSRHFISLHSEPCWYLVSRGAGLTAEPLALYCLLTETVIILTQIFRRGPFSSALLISTYSLQAEDLFSHVPEKTVASCFAVLSTMSTMKCVHPG